MARARVYLDWNATTPPHPDVLAAMSRVAETAWANPSSVHGDGRRARAVVEDARLSIATLAGVDPRDVTFTSGGTEANNLALRSAVAERSASLPLIVSSKMEHPSVAKVALALEQEGRARVHWLSVEPSGVIDLADLDRVLATDRVALVTVQAVNHETGIIQPVSEVIERAHAVGAHVHVDAIQAWGKLEVPGGWDSASMAPHKMRGPKGIGALVTREGRKLSAILHGGSQERGARPGTVDAVLAAGFDVAAKRARTSARETPRLEPLRDRLETALLSLVPKRGERPRRVGDPSRRASHVTNLLFPGWLGAELVAALDLEEISVSSGAACSAGTVTPSPVLAAMFGEPLARSGVRISIGETTTDDDISAAEAAFRLVVAR